jgi:carboxyl-terminal processing protease
MVHEIDPDGGEYWSEQEFQDFRNGPSPGSGAIGVEIRRRDGTLILSPISGGAALSVGVKFGDHLRTIDGTPIAQSTLFHAVRMLQGPIGSKVTVGIYRPSSGKSLTFSIERVSAQVPLPRLSKRNGNVRVLQLHSLSPSLLQSAFTLLGDEWEKERFSGLVLDLRGNQGGVVESAIALAATFLPEGAIIAAMEGRGPSDNHIFRATPSDYKRGVTDDPVRTLPEELRRLPLIVLVDEQTASGAEIVVAALRDHNRASIVGRPTFGRGSIQTIVPISGAGAIRYTSGFWVSPKGKSIDRTPIQPDRVVADPSGDLDLAAATDLFREQRSAPKR